MGKVLRIPFIDSSPKIQPVYSIDNSAQKKSEAEEKARKEALARQRRGIESTINTSYNGILDENTKFTRKKLLGD